ncbi:hypothetical protein CAOG_03284 [Capsaspora owczarzaki ATCC 30864]|uniref:Transcription factor CBF/NF-Y/archaeal histone domain-containing protein n=1 Tax=Capsaspora owczarzaki (strain ATCC 30864) TaxID=595528 RepID=A0A0D2WP06_CAPO3|nr:hypothetical protein CAOG_03284 [Capsaspora owczarzaki ATCC 30864]KJE92283.1 hypothetical protein CAOG_003284 [Capsaspora owczarzaki ATCC 30864]|eukprot:XP_004364123.1 hypothetical protein CAOG_03284 [Capsaspora owczarzaki ATCC 30864]
MEVESSSSADALAAKVAQALQERQQSAADAGAAATTTTTSAPSALKASLPLSRVKRIMRSDEDIGLLSADAVFLVTRATEMFVAEFAKKVSADLGKRKTVQYKDVANVVEQDTAYQFLADIIPQPVALGKVKGKPSTSGVAPGKIYPTNTPFVLQFANRRTEENGKHLLERRDPRRDKKKAASTRKTATAADAAKFFGGARQAGEDVDGEEDDGGDFQSSPSARRSSRPRQQSAALQGMDDGNDIGDEENGDDAGDE